MLVVKLLLLTVSIMKMNIIVISPKDYAYYHHH